MAPDCVGSESGGPASADRRTCAPGQADGGAPRAGLPPPCGARPAPRSRSGVAGKAGRRAGRCADMAFAGPVHRPEPGEGKNADTPCGNTRLLLIHSPESRPGAAPRVGPAARPARMRPPISSRSNSASAPKIPRAGRCIGIAARTIPPTTEAVPNRIRSLAEQIVRRDSRRRRSPSGRPGIHVAGVLLDRRGTGSKGALRACPLERRIPSGKGWAIPLPAGVGHMDGRDLANVQAVPESQRSGGVAALGAPLASRPCGSAGSRWKQFRSARSLACRHPRRAQSIRERPARRSSNPERDGTAVADWRETLAAALRRSAIAGTGRVWCPPGRFPRRYSRVPP